MNNKYKILLSLILLLGFLLRIFNINWDDGHIFHPDERAIIMKTVDISYPTNINEFFSINSPFNTNFFAYGNFPIYLLKIFGDVFSFINPALANYDGIYLLGRLLNSIASTLTILLVFLFTKRVFNIKTATIAALFYAVAVFPIQNSHFFTVDTILTLFTFLCIYLMDFYLEKPLTVNATLLGFSFGLALATKISIAPLLIIIILVLLLANFIKIKKNSTKSILQTTYHLFILGIVTTITFFTAQPYALIDFNDFLEQILAQSKMGSDPFIFPYTLQYVGKIPVIYEIKNIILWGLGIPLGLISFIGLILLIVNFITKAKKHIRLLPIILFFCLHFLLTASYAVGWMRYLLPIYPLLTIFAAYLTTYYIFPFFDGKINFKENVLLRKISLMLFFAIICLWTVLFLSVYIYPHTKFTASTWINENIPAGSTIATEHWDDALPVHGQDRYQMLSLPLYEPDTESKWQGINSMLESTDYIIIASNRLHTPLRKLTDCDNLPQGRCFARTAEYYNNLFSGNSKFKKVAEFNSFPSTPILNIEINDQSADESFTVYDHPEVLIFQKVN